MFSVFAYKDKRVTMLIWNVKYKKSLRAANIGGYALGRYITELFVFSKPILIIPMPITAERLRERGYNQCHLLLDEMCSDSFILEKDLLVRIHHDSRHTLKNRKERLASAKGLFAVNEKCLGEKYMDKDITVIVVDDVITTGSTIKEAIQTLKNAGFEKVYGVSVAH
ncbi:MAG: phosphoribosyltransferase family protein [Candidatus Paceibacterota bacterium]